MIEAREETDELQLLSQQWPASMGLGSLSGGTGRPRQGEVVASLVWWPSVAGTRGLPQGDNPASGTVTAAAKEARRAVGCDCGRWLLGVESTLR